MEKNNSTVSHNVRIKDKNTLEIDCVINVESFDEDYLNLSTFVGGISVEGHGLKIESLTKDDGKILITGEIKGLYYYEEKTKRGIGKLFK